MERLLLDIGLCLLFYFFLIFLIKWKSARPDTDDSDNDDGGLPIDINFDPTLDLPPGVTLPVNDGPVTKKKLEEELV